ncbi:di-heme oxidoredictase family protein [Psychromonas sp. SP041]|uniref:di-heme oxidoredictase family protein n=1 Tax=Psychromonas sp. SP041 TaxID=1365007 RepID=UPI0004720D24|nr:di-heme oxidoredictase family protein [Psychromonas sp. SP041]
MNKKTYLLLSLMLAGCGGGGSDNSASETGADTVFDLGPAGGVATVEYSENNNFLQFIPDLDISDYHGASQGRELFIATWSPAPGDRDLLDGYGPLAITDSCSNCHEASARAESLKSDGSTGNGILFRLRDEDGNEDPLLGPQLQTFSEDNIPEGTVTWSEGSNKEVLFHLNNNQYSLADGVALAPRLSPQLVGMGLLDLVSESTILEYEDINDSDMDGISGRANQQSECIGRFGWKAIHCTLKGQVAGAFQQDMGLTTTLNALEPCTESQSVCALYPSGGKPEVSDNSLEAINDFLTILAVPERRIDDESEFMAGKALFESTGCDACHRETLQTGDIERFPILSNQVFYPYTDLLLHDMGEDLSDGAKEAGAEPTEWRTPPLWGLGLIEGDGKSRFLHDGRASDLDTAILWHGGEAQASKEAFVELTEEQRNTLLAFLRSI